MEYPARSIAPLLFPALLLVALLGYLAGSHRAALPVSHEDFGGRVDVVSDAGLLIEYPSGWERTRRSPPIPGLALSSAVSLTAAGTDGGTGLVIGELPHGQPGPLPQELLARLRALPRTEVVELISTQAFRYSHVKLAGYRSDLTLYAIPATAVGAARVLACFSTSSPTPASSTCERIVAAATLVGPATVALTPEPRYAAKLAGSIAALDRARLRDRREMSLSSSIADVAALASAVAARYSASLDTLSALEPPQAAQLAQQALAVSLHDADSAYGALALAARSNDASGYDAARVEVSVAEDSVDRALRAYSLIGYGEAP